MPHFKYHTIFGDAPYHPTPLPAGALAPFDLDTLRSKGIVGRLTQVIFLPLMRAVFFLLRTFWPVFKIGRFIIVSRDQGVRQVLENAALFNVPFGPEMIELASDPDGVDPAARANFALGMDGDPHKRQNAIIRAVIEREDSERVAALSKKFAAALIESAGGRIDVVSDLISRVAAEVCSRYFGIAVSDPDAFAGWAISCSALLFADPFGSEQTRQIALNGAARLRLTIDDAIDRAHKNPGRGNDTLVDRLVNLKWEGRPVADAEIRAILFGLIVGFVPTNTLAATNILMQLLSRPADMERAVAAACAATDATPGDEVRDARRSLFTTILREAARLRPALSPGQWRYCRNGGSITDEAGRVTAVRPGTVVLASTMSALVDRRAYPSPQSFMTDRDRDPVDKPDLTFGDGAHACLGKYLALNQLTEVLLILLSRPNLRVAPDNFGRLQSVGIYPRRLDMEFTSSAAAQSMFLIVAPIVSGKTKAEMDALIGGLKNPADEPIRTALDKTGIVHFASLSTIASGSGVTERLDLVFELSVDGAVVPAIEQIIACAGDLLRPIFREANPNPDMALDEFMAEKVVTLHGAPWGPTGLNFNGTDEFAVRDIEKQAELARLAQDAVDDHLHRYLNRGSRAMQTLMHVRRIINQDRYLKLAENDDPALARLMQDAAAHDYDAYLLRPGRKGLKIADWKRPTKWSAIWAFFKSTSARPFELAVAALLAAVSLWLWHVIDVAHASSRIWAFIRLIGGAVTLTVLILALVAGFCVALLRWKEAHDVVDDREAPIDHIQAINASENHPGFAQNHIMAIGDLKPGLFRRLVHAFALWGIGATVGFFFRPGFVLNMGTIHYARWWHLPGTDKAVFFSNYNGSWDSYLEDFITRARWGQTAAWSNWVGFPKTRFLIQSGAQDGDRFKRWVRCQQQIVPFWYSRFPQLTTDQIRNNALIHYGLARARTDTEARDWLRCFGSSPRQSNVIETDEVQALVFNGLRRFPHSTCMVVKLPPRAPDLAVWQKLLNGGRIDVSRAPKLKALKGLTASLKNGRTLIGLGPDLCVAFGDRRLGGGDATGDETAAGAIFLALSAAGLNLYGRLRGEVEGSASDIPGTFPSVFKMGMANRARILGDVGAASPERWRWTDADTGAGSAPAEAVLFIYAASPEKRAAAVAVHTALLEAFGGAVIDAVASAPSAKGGDYEHFGFRDGISQPVIRGTERHARGVPARDLVAPGEFILGYENGQGYFPPSPVVRAEADLGCDLPALASHDLSRFPNFGAVGDDGDVRDFGRNGSFLVIRELAQDVEGFAEFTEMQSRTIKAAYGSISTVIGQPPDADWVAAKMMGRWRDGRPLVGNPVQAAIKPAAHEDMASPEERENDFAYGIDDPQGLACPFGAHIRRGNPRDSMQPGDEAEQVITNRHRLLRRGRTYARPSGQGGNAEKGVLFVSLCGDLERQFEFVQQTWVDSPSFHGLAGEPDPVIGTTPPDAARGFTIPTAAGPIKLKNMQNFVTMRGGGYFFLPSRAALIYLANHLGGIE
jgi:Dyp-type peroxidase family